MNQDDKHPYATVASFQHQDWTGLIGPVMLQARGLLDKYDRSHRIEAGHRRLIILVNNWRVLFGSSNPLGLKVSPQCRVSSIPFLTFIPCSATKRGLQDSSCSNPAREHSLRAIALER